MKDRKFCKNTSFQTDTRRSERLYVAVEQFEYSPELAKRVYHLGIPHFTDSISTASLTVTGRGKPIFDFNRTFFDDLGYIALVFVILHETLHYAFRHHLRCHDRLPALWNVACDLVVNAFLLQKVSFAQVSSRSFHEFLQSAITFSNLPIVPTSNELVRITAEEVYDLLVKNLRSILGKASNLKACDEHTWSELNADNGHEQDRLDEDSESIHEKSCGSTNDCDGQIIPLEANANGMPDRDEALDELTERAQQVFRDWMPAWGNTPSGELRAIGETDKSSNIDWESILSRRIASSIRLTLEERWAPPNRKIAWLYPDVLLPADHEVEQYQNYVLVAIDASGSISRSVLDRFLGVARSIPADRVQLTTISFDTKVYPVDIRENVPAIRGGGGTSFKAVEMFATEQMNRYPDLIVVLTDGYAPRPAVQHLDRWFWLVTENGTTSHVEGIGRCCRIDRSSSVSADQILSYRKS
jgi:predicted metal-dependent peptidase